MKPAAGVCIAPIAARKPRGRFRLGLAKLATRLTAQHSAARLRTLIFCRCRGQTELLMGLCIIMPCK